MKGKARSLSRGTVVTGSTGTHLKKEAELRKIFRLEFKNPEGRSLCSY